MRILSASLILLMLAVSIFIWRGSSSRADLSREMERLSATQLDEKILRARSILEDRPDDIQAMIQMGIAHFRKGPVHYPVALKELKAAAHLGAQDVRLLYFSGRMFEEMGFLRRAAEEYEKFLRNQPSHLEVRQRLAQIYFQEGRLEMAQRHLERVAEEFPRDPTVWINLARVYRARESPEAALRAIERAARLTQNLPSEALALQGEILLEKNDLALAEEVLKKAIEKNPKALELFLHLGLVLKKQSRMEESRQAFEQALALAPGNLQAKRALGIK